MRHEIAKLLLEHAKTRPEFDDAVRAAIKLGMPLAEIEEYLDWLGVVPREDRPPPPAATTPEESD